MIGGRWSAIGVKKTPEKFKLEIYDLVKDEYTVLEDYIDYKTPVSIRHNICSHEYKVQPKNFFSGQRCKKCSDKKQRKTNEEFTKEVCELVGGEYVFQESYINAVTKIEVKHMECGRIYKVSPNNFLGGNRCRSCSLSLVAKENTKTDEQFRNEVFDAVGNEYVPLDKYKGTNKSIKILHNTCGNILNMEPSNFLNGARCIYCWRKRFSKSRIITNDEFLARIEEDVLDEYEFLEEYVKSSIPIRVRHKSCGREYKVTPNNFLRGKRCRNCTKSKGEDIIHEYLMNSGVLFDREVSFNGLKNVNKLRYDFCILDDVNGSILFLIEFDGKQHFQPVDFFGGEEEFFIRQKNDRLKDDYAKLNNIPLLRISYTEIDRVEEIIDKYLNEYLF